MINALRYFLFVIPLMLQGCQHPQNNEEHHSKKPDLSKAASYNVELGLGYLKQGDRSRAKKKLLVALEQAPNSAPVNAAIAYYFEQTKEMDAAKKYYLKAMRLSPNDGAQLNNYGAYLCRQGDYKQAETYFLKAVNDIRYLHTSGAYENAGLCALALSDYKKAKFYFINALNQDPSRRESLYELIKLESKMGHDREALQLIQAHPNVVQKDEILLSLARDVASKARKYTKETRKK